MNATAAATKNDGQQFVLARTFDAPRDLVFACFTESEHMKHWWGPKGVTIVGSKIDLRPGGMSHYGMRTPDGNTMWGKFVYREIVRPERIVGVNSFSDEAGGTARHPGHASWPLEMLTVFTFADSGGKTKLTIHWSPLDATEEERATFAANHDSMRGGWTGSLDQLEAHLAETQGR